jgi:hypothetical protein
MSVLVTGTAYAQASIQPMYNAMGAYSSGMMNVVSLGQPLAFQARNARQHAEGQGANRPSEATQRSAQFTFTARNDARTVNDYVARIARQDPTAAAQLRTALAGKDIPEIFGELVGPFGLGSHDVADAMTAHLIMRVMVATGAQPPSTQGVRNIRDSVAQALAHDPKMTSEAYRNQIGSEAQLDFVLVNSTWQAMRAGKYPANAAAQYRQSAAASLLREGLDLSTTQLTEGGFFSKRPG